ncbi:hypothetical protein CTI12_AA370850 [Artemisia annua]|uniref:Helitron helicase-like domain-containing protein n=1 Tax=Artemisia annua TaxID=35608 RepID=A0A2U1MKE3_ARTAN|nr:hypothetical protein CTI12_AA370850 [Artemisia annua]
MKTKKKAVRRVTSLLPLESVELSSFDQEGEFHGMHLQPETIISDLGSVDPLLNSVNESPCKARLTTSDLCTAANYREEAITEGARKDGTFSVNYECCYASPICLWISLLRVVHIPLMCAPVQLHKQQMDAMCKEARPESFLAYMVLELLWIKENGKCLNFLMKMTFVLGGSEDIFLINNTEGRVIPEHLADGSTASGVGPSSHETSQNFATLTEHCNVDLPRNDRRRRSQVRMRPSSDRTQVPPQVRSRNRRSRQGPPDTYVHMGRCDQACRHCSARFWYDERIISGNRRRVDYHKCCNVGKVRLHDQDEHPTGQSLRPDIVEHLIELLDEHNQLVQLFRTATDKMAEADIPEFRVRLFGVVGSRQHELPTGDSIGAIVFKGGPDVETEFDVVVEQHDHQLQYVSKLNASYMSMQFPLLFFFGEDGYHLGRVLLSRRTSSDPPKKMSMKMYYAQMEHSSSIVASGQPTGKAIVTHSDDIGLNNLKETDTGKAIYVKVYRKWIPTNKQGKPVVFCCMLIDGQVQITIL